MYTEFEKECHVRDIDPSFELFNLWAETTHRFFQATDNMLFEELAAI